MDLRNLMMMIKEKKEMNANMSLEFDCKIDTEDPAPLVKVINYIINYLTPLTSQAIEISLNAYREGSMLSFAAFTDKTELSPISDQIEEALKNYNATLKVTHEQGKYIQIIINFN
ncbi:MAG: hypothetical protein JXR46_10540 [Calditrichaceae bacterium]|nr:hypothetical protein [Calditrichaceae bacterium]MBN2709473.1 hypothetical protein [Calditrichaceae bacterium]RQV92986.1 MAG: hypothetical protein EH224_13705 [Calditrichota bacterium]